MSEPVRDDGYDDLLDAVGADEPFYLECENGHGSLPPRWVCPHCGSRELTETVLPEGGTVDTFTIVEIATPELADDTPYVTAIASFGPVRVTGLLRGIEPGDVETGMSVSLDVGTTETTGERTLVLQSR